MELNKEELKELGFLIGENDFCYLSEDRFSISINPRIDIFIDTEWHDTNAKTMQDIKDLIRLFK